MPTGPVADFAAYVEAIGLPEPTGGPTTNPYTQSDGSRGWIYPSEEGLVSFVPGCPHRRFVVPWDHVAIIDSCGDDTAEA
jgi:hypothetical protein